MPFLTPLAPALRRRAPACVLPSLRVRRFRATPLRPAMSEDDMHREDRHHHIDAHKKDSVEKAKAGKAEWKNELASSSEAAVKADREEIDASEDTIKAMQKESEKVLKQDK